MYNIPSISVEVKRKFHNQTIQKEKMLSFSPKCKMEAMGINIKSLSPIQPLDLMKFCG